MATLTLKNVKKIYPHNGDEAKKSKKKKKGDQSEEKKVNLQITEGELYIGDRLVNDVAPKDRDIATIFQSYALYPHMTVYDNL